MGQLWSIQVFVVGQARRPGTYTLSSLSTLVTALFVPGDPPCRDLSVTFNCGEWGKPSPTSMKTIS